MSGTPGWHLRSLGLMTSQTCWGGYCSKISGKGCSLHILSRKTQTGVCVCTWLGKCPSNYFVSARIVAFKGILGHVGISSYSKLCQPKQTQFPVSSRYLSPNKSLLWCLWGEISNSTAQLISSEAIFLTWSEKHHFEHQVLCFWHQCEPCPWQEVSLGLKHLLDSKLSICLHSHEVTWS